MLIETVWPNFSSIIQKEREQKNEEINRISNRSNPCNYEFKFGECNRGTTAGYPVNPALQRIQVTPTSKDPVVSTCFAVEGQKYGQGVVYIATETDLAGVALTEANYFAALEAEIAVEIAPLQFASRASMSITASQARSILSNMGINVPSSIANPTELQNALQSLPRLSSAQIQQFINAAKQIVEGN